MLKYKFDINVKKTTKAQEKQKSIGMRGSNRVKLSGACKYPCGPCACPTVCACPYAGV